MSIWGLIAGAAAGLLGLGGPIGALAGRIAGHIFPDRLAGRIGDGADAHGERRVRERDEVAFTIGVIALAAKLAKADGTVTRDEVDVFKRVFPVPHDEAANVGHLFNLAKQDVAGFDSYARQLAGLFRGRPGVLEDLLDTLFLIAKADGSLHPSELAYLEEVATLFGFSPEAFERVRAAHFGPEGEDPYVILGVTRSAGDDEIRKAYLRLVKAHHPDSLTARGVPEAFVRVAGEKLVAINGAWEMIRKERGQP